jgi:hypothetical protein
MDEIKVALFKKKELFFCLPQRSFLWMDESTDGRTDGRTDAGRMLVAELCCAYAVLCCAELCCTCTGIT